MNTLKRARTLNTFDESTNSAVQYRIIAESDKSYKTSDNKVIAKKSISDKLVKNTIDYRYNVVSVDDSEAIYTQVQSKLASMLEFECKSDIRAFESIFNVRTTKRYYNILKSDSVILNRASSIELLLTESDAEKLAGFDCSKVEATETKLSKYCSHIKTGDIYSLVLKDKPSILKVAEILA